MSVGCQQSHKDESKFDIDLQVKERPAQTGDLDMEWSLAPSASGKLGLASIVPGMLSPLELESRLIACVGNVGLSM